MTDNKISPVVACSAFSKDQKLVAIAPNTEDVHIFSTAGSTDASKWEKKYSLKEVWRRPSLCRVARVRERDRERVRVEGGGGEVSTPRTAAQGKARARAELS
jgi:hypothetical protein